MQRVLVTGAAGFIGSHVCRCLIGRGCEVVAIDNLSKGIRERLDEFAPNQRFVFARGVLLDRQFLEKQSEGCDAIVHLAALKIPRYSDALDTIMFNLMGTKAVLDIAARLHAKVVFASTSDVYGKSNSLPFSEGSDLVLGPSTSRRWSYATSKLLDEHLAFAYSDRFGLEVTGLRYFGTYGPGQYIGWWGGPQGLFIQAALEDGEIEIHGDGKQTRSFTYVGDAAELTVRALERESATDQIINVGTDEEISIIDLAGIICELVGSTPRLRYVDYGSFTKNYEDVRRRVADLSKCERTLGPYRWVGLGEGLAETVDWQRSLGPHVAIYDIRARY